MAPITAVAVLNIPASVKIEDPSTPEGQKWAAACKTLAANPECTKFYWSRFVEDADKVGLAMDFTSREAETAYTHSAQFKADMAPIKEIHPANITTFHVPLSPSSAVLSSPVTEWMTAYFPVDYSEADKAAWAAKSRTLHETVKPAAVGLLGYADGWTVDELPFEQAEGGKAIAFIAAFGWESVEAHEALRKTDVLKKAVADFGGNTGALKVSMNHFKFQ